MVSIKHFSHDHTLEFEDQIKIRPSCNGCGNFILGAMYSCSNCNFFVHKECLNLPMEFNHPNHSEHPLILHGKPKYACVCVVCNKTCKGFTYHCSTCKMFGLCIESALLVLRDRKIKLNCHPHSLTLLQRPALFRCDACDKEGQDISYACDICPFWIHKDCASLRSTVHNSHPHQLSLAHHPPVTVFHYQLMCELCRATFRLSDLLYYCGPCKYFIHAKCFRPDDPPKQELEARLKWDVRDLIDHICKSKYLILSLPWTEMSSSEMKPFMTPESCVQERKSEIKHFSHHHPLALSSSMTIENENGEEILCDACIEPIFDQYYTCVECSYFIHPTCAYLPLEVRYPPHDHQLQLKNLDKKFGYFYCSFCQMPSNGFFYECEPCSLKIDLHCFIFFILTKVTHDGHHHRLECDFFIFDELCEACGRNIIGMGYACRFCRIMYMHYECVILPSKARHPWDKHNLFLQFRPGRQDEDEFYCEICEEEIHPRHWHYYCKVCDQSFHPFCIPRFGKDRFMKFGSTIKVDIHEHLLISVRDSGFGSSCHSCGVDLYGHKGFECGTCIFFLCYGCACQVPAAGQPSID